MQMSEASDRLTLIISHINKEKEYVWRKTKKDELKSKEYLLLSVAFLPNPTERWIGGFGSWQGFSFSLPLSLWTEARVLLGLLCCAGGKLPIRGTLIEHWKQEFYKGADLLFITSHSLLLFLPHSSVFHCSLCHTPASFLGLFSDSLYTAFSADPQPPLPRRI